MNTHILGFTLQELNVPLNDAEIGQASTKLLAVIPADEYPYFVEHVRQHLSESREDYAFEFVLDLILDGLERVRDPRV